MTSFSLKLIAIASMLCDHLGNVIFKNLSWLNFIGRISFPIFAFQISEGYLHTKNVKKYFLRLLLFAVLSQIPFSLFLSVYTEEVFTLNIFFTLALGLFGIILYEKILTSKILVLPKWGKLFLGFFLFFLIAYIGEFIHVDYGFFGVFLVFTFYFFRNNKKRMLFSISILCFLKYFILLLENGFSFISITNTLLFLLFTIIPIFFIYHYNGKQGPKFKYFFYFFYPIHILILYLLFR